LLSQAKAFCFNVAQESTLIGRSEINSLLKIKVVKRPFKPIATSRIRKKKFGDRYWFVSASPLSDRAYEKIKNKVEKTTTEISRSENIEEDDIGFLRWRVKTEFSMNAIEGDQVILKFSNESRTRSDIYPPSSILKKEVVDGFTYFYHDARNSEERKIPWTKFQLAVRNLNIEKQITTRTKTISVDDMVKLKALWNGKRYSKISSK
jgi:hypothetical protein